MDTIKSFWSWVKTTFAPGYQSEIEAYLADSTDHADLEHRMQYIMRRGLL